MKSCDPSPARAVRHARPLLLLLSLLLLILTILPGCSLMAPARPALGPNQARISGRQATMWVSPHKVLVAQAYGRSKYQSSLVISAGHNRLRLRYRSTSKSGGLVGAAFVGMLATKYDKIVEFDAEPGHEYFVDCLLKTVLIGMGEIDYLITDATTDQVILETHGKTR